ncbi:hypothetical protein [Prosthecobacter sp.]|uniref:hypothetical protein n=1 Tax=Prosthecobacter sp. TaxID=1965333 RepID=UPI001D5FF484|nr:hypothetical protein [Prosthecobacter sp.]MCB1278182.1 hypothetical protein [Prosthecobacter sp.]
MIRALISVFLLILWLPPRSLQASTPLVLTVRVHLVQSVTHPRLQSTLSEAGVRAIFDDVNVIWAQAGIRFEIEAIGTLQALNIPPKKWFEKDRNWVKAAIPTSEFSPAAIDVCFVKEMGPNGFFYGEPVVVCENPEFTKVKGGTDNAVARVAAHELGHVLFLKHRQDHTNLMASGRNGVSLNPQEITDARGRALQILGQPQNP